MANKADGSVSIKANVDVAKAQKELKKLEADIEKTEQALNDKKTEKSGIEAQLEDAKVAADNARKSVEALENKIKGAKRILSGEVSSAPGAYIAASENLPEWEKQLPTLDKDFGEKITKVDNMAQSATKLGDEIAASEQNLDAMKSRAGELHKKLAASEKNAGGMNKATKKAANSAAVFANRLKAVVRSALIFTVITQALAKLREWMGKVVKTNAEAQAAFAKLKGALLTMAQPLIEVVIPALIKFVGVLTSIVAALAGALAQLFGSSAEASKKAASALYEETKALEGAGDAAEDAQKSLAGFDEINQISTKEGGTGGANGDTGGGETVAPDFNYDTGPLQEQLASILAFEEPLASLAALIAGGLGVGALVGSWIPALVAAIGGILYAFTDAYGQGDRFVGGLKDILKGLIDFVKGVFTGDLTKAMQGVDRIFSGLKGIADSVIVAVKNAFNSFLDWLDKKTGGKLTGIIEVIRGLFNALATFVRTNLSNTLNTFKTILNGVITFLKGVFTGNWELAWKGVKNVFKAILNGVISAFESAINFFINGINAVINGINSISFEWPDWVPGFGGESFGPNLKQLKTVALPRLATGAVIPPNREFLAVLGDQKSGTNIEAPESLIRKIVREEAGGNTELLAEILDAIRAGRVMKVDKRILAQVTAEGINDMTKQTGKPVLLY